jgi:hypothetical protein
MSCDGLGASIKRGADMAIMKEIVVTNGLRVRSEGIAITVTASMLLTKASGYLALKNPFKRNLFLFFV